MQEKEDLRAEFSRVALPEISNIHRAAVFLTKDKMEAEDLVQETYLRAFRFFHRFQRGTNCKAWLLRILRNLFLNRYRQAQREPQALMEDKNGQIIDTHSISAGLDYPGVGPEHAWLKDSGRATYVAINDDEALAAFHGLTRTEGIMPALESSHALAYAGKLAPRMKREQIIIINLSGRGDKDIQTVAAREGISL